MGRGKRWAQGASEAVSAVVGSILILVIMIMAIGGIIAFGVPIINGLQDYAEFQNVVTQFQELDGDIRNLRDPQNVRLSTVSLNKGDLELSSGDRWVYTVIGADAAPLGNLASFRVTRWEVAYDDDAVAELIVEGTFSGAANVLNTAVFIHKVRGSTFIELNECPGAPATGVTISCTYADGGGGNTDGDLATDVFRVQLRVSNVPYAEAWIMNVGRLSFRQSASNELNQVHYEMGAVMTQQNDAFFIQQVPTIKEPDEDLDDKTMFIRALQLDVDEDEDVSGKGRHTIVTNLVDNYGAARERPAYDDFRIVRVQVDGVMEEAFCRYFSDRSSLGWTIDAGDCDTTTDADSTHAYMDADDLRDLFVEPTATFRFDLIHSEVDSDLRPLST